MDSSGLGYDRFAIVICQLVQMNHSKLSLDDFFNITSFRWVKQFCPRYSAVLLTTVTLCCSFGNRVDWLWGRRESSFDWFPVLLFSPVKRIVLCRYFKIPTYPSFYRISLVMETRDRLGKLLKQAAVHPLPHLPKAGRYLEGRRLPMGYSHRIQLLLHQDQLRRKVNTISIWI